MKKKDKLLLFILAFLLALPGTGQPLQQNQLNDARFQLVRRSLEFLATDRKTFTNVTQPLCTECSNKEDLVTFIKTNQLKGAEGRLGQWLTLAGSELTPDNLAALKLKIIYDLTSGPGKDSRKELASYKAYAADMDMIVANARTPAPETTPEPTAPAAATIRPTDSSPGNDDSDDTYLLPPVYLYILLGLLAMTVAILLIRLRKALGKARGNDEDLKKARKDLKALEKKLEEQDTQRRRSAEEITFLKDQLQVSEEALRLERMKNLESQTQPLPVFPEVPEPQKNKAPSIMYAKYADLGDGFSASEVTDKADPETIFEITRISETSGTFKVADNQDAQRYALTNSSYFFGTTAQYDSLPPSPGCTVITDSPGELVLQGNKWRITVPAKIRFV